jgi:hypothetical protein
MDPGEWANRLDELRRTATKTKRTLGRDEPLLDAYLYVSRVRCGRPTCKCMQTDYRHEKWCLSFVENGRSRTLTVPDRWLPEMAKATSAYRGTRSLIREFGTGAQAATRAANRRLSRRVTAGRKLLAKLVVDKAKRTAKGST